MIFLTLWALFNPTAQASEGGHKDRVAYYKSIDIPLHTQAFQHWREPMVGWAYKLVYQMGLHPIIVSGATELMDRYLLKHKVSDDEIPQIFTSCLILSIKFYQSDISMNMFAEFSCGNFTAEDLRNTEIKILESLDWKINYVVPEKYVFEYFDYMETIKISLKSIREYHWIKYKTHDIVRRKVSHSKSHVSSLDIAISSISEAIDSSLVPPEIKLYYYQIMKFVFTLD